MSFEISDSLREEAVEQADEWCEWAVVSSDGVIEYSKTESEADAMCRVRERLLAHVQNGNEHVVEKVQV